MGDVEEVKLHKVVAVEAPWCAELQVYEVIDALSDR